LATSGYIFRDKRPVKRGRAKPRYTHVEFRIAARLPPASYIDANFASAASLIFEPDCFLFPGGSDVQRVEQLFRFGGL
jgi:hypothetical protein